MEATAATIPILRIQQLPAYNQGGGQHQTPFAQGQLLQGIISARNGTNLFTIDIGGQQVQAESTTQLQVGQKLDLQVATLSPRVELQIVSNPANRLIGNSIHLIGQQALLLPELAQLSEKSGFLPNISNDARGTLQLYASALATGGTIAAPRSEQLSGLLGQLAGTSLQTLLSPQQTTASAFNETITSLLQQLSQTAALPAQSAERAVQLATMFANASAPQASTAGQTPAQAQQPVLLTNQEVVLLLNLAGKQGPSQANNLIASLLPALQNGENLPVLPAMQTLVRFLADLDAELSSLRQPALDGGQVQQLVERLGMNMEQLLAEGRRQEAVQTLKYALLDLSQQLPAEDKAAAQADQIVKSIELYQLLQIRLASESLLFLPLPFSFLNQGYLVVDAEQHKNDQKETNSQRTPAYELHLQLEGLGNIQINLRKENDRLVLTFYAQDAERVRFLAGFRDELERWLTSADLESVQFLVGAKEPVKSLLERIVQGVTGMVDTRA